MKFGVLSKKIALSVLVSQRTKFMVNLLERTNKNLVRLGFEIQF